MPHCWSDVVMGEDDLVTRAQLSAEGLDSNRIRRLIRAGELVRVRRGHYLRGPGEQLDAVARHRLLIAATVPGLHPAAVVSHASAGVLHGLPVPGRALRRVTVLRDGSGSGGLCRWTHLRQAPLSVQDCELIDQVEVTSLRRTVVDLCRTLRFADALAVADVALARGLSQEDLLAAMRRTRQPGNVQARAVIAVADPRSESPGESRCRATIHLAGLPPPQLQYVIRTETGAFVARVDFAWPERGVVGEYDGAVKYGQLLRPGETSADVLMREKAREERIRLCGYTVIRWAAADLANRKAFRAGVLRAFQLANRT